ncbi:MAG: NTP transferase domain-containing protein [Sulfolobales archaeon]
MIDTRDSASSIYPIDIVIMAGGKGSRLGGLEKPLLKICGERIIDHVIREVK